MKHNNFTPAPINAFFAVLFLLHIGALLPATSQSLSSFERDRGRMMLKIIKDDIKKNYYDPTFRGIDLDAHFKAAEEKIKQATSNAEIFGIIAQALLGFKDSHTFFIPPARVNRIEYGWQMQMIGDTCYVTAVKPGSDAAAKGLKEGDVVHTVDGYQPTRENLWVLHYLAIRKTIFLLLLMLLAIPVTGQTAPSQQTDKSPHKSNFITVNGVKLHYLDWGGKGEPLLFLAGFGNTAHAFDELAPKFTDRFRVLALTRRGHGESDKPETGYSIKTLVEDIRQFLKAMKIKRVNLVGHSMAGSEITHFAGLYPQRAGKLVYLDAISDLSRGNLECYLKDPMMPPVWKRLFLEISGSPGASEIPIPPEVPLAEYKLAVTIFKEGILDTRREYSKVKAPALSLVADI